jgi:hypothetical protein
MCRALAQIAVKAFAVFDFCLLKKATKEAFKVLKRIKHVTNG